MELGQDNHARVSAVNDELKKRGYLTWFDNDKLSGNYLYYFNMIVYAHHGHVLKLTVPEVNTRYMDRGVLVLLDLNF